MTSNGHNGVAAEEKARHPYASAKGGMNLYDEGGIIPAAIKEVLSKIANKMVKGQFTDILKISSPAFIHHPVTYVESASMDLLNAQRFLTPAAETDDPIERLKLIISMYVGGSHIVPAEVQSRAPLNPILGETVQRVFPDGTRFYGEQTSHHPPTTNFLLEGPNNSYRFSGFFEYKAWLAGLNSLQGSRIGK